MILPFSWLKSQPAEEKSTIFTVLPLSKVTLYASREGKGVEIFSTWVILSVTLTSISSILSSKARTIIPLETEILPLKSIALRILLLKASIQSAAA